MMPELGNLVDIRLVPMLTSTRVSALTDSLLFYSTHGFTVLAMVGKYSIIVGQALKGQ